MKYTDLEQIEQDLKTLATSKYPKEVDVVDKVMATVKQEKNEMHLVQRKERRVRWTIGAISSIAAASVALLIFVGNGTNSHAQNTDNNRMAKFISDIYNSQRQADVVFYMPDYIDIILGLDEEEAY